MIPISVCIIGKNEEKHVDECLRRLIPLNCELIFVDTGSTDHTVEIVSNYTKNIYHFNWIDDFSAARNFSVSKASNDWILVIDCDEFLEDSEELYHTLPSFLASTAGKKNEIGIMKQKSYQDRDNQQTLVTINVARYFHKDYFHFTGKVHEQLTSLSNTTQPRFLTPFSVSHMGYFGDDILKKKVHRNISLLLEELDAKGPSPYIYFQLGQSYHSIQKEEDALFYFDLGLAMDVNPKYDYVQQMVESYGYTLLSLGLLQDALGLEGIYDTFGQHADFVFLMGLIYMKNGLFTEAIAEFKKASAFADASVEGVNSFMAYYNIGVIYECSGNKEEAISCYKRCGDYAPAVSRLTALL